MKKSDFFLLFSLFILSFLPYIFFFSSPASSACYAEISINGSIVRRILLTGHRGKETWRQETPYGQNTFTVENEQLSIIDADCPDHQCIKMGWAKKNGDTLVCLPHHLVVTVCNTKKESPDIIPLH